jgi:hypothetical protein
MIEGILLAATLASAPCEPTTVIVAPGYSIVIGGNCPVGPELRAIIDDIKERRTTTITKTGDELPLPVPPPPELTKAKVETKAAKPPPKKAKAKPTRKKATVKTRCGSKRAVWYRNKAGNMRYRCK